VQVIGHSENAAAPVLGVKKLLLQLQQGEGALWRGGHDPEAFVRRKKKTAYFEKRRGLVRFETARGGEPYTVHLEVP